MTNRTIKLDIDTALNFTPVVIGTSPAGVKWTAYRPEHVEPMRTRFAEVMTKHDAQLVSVSGLTRNATGIIADTIYGREDEDAFTVLQTVVRAPRAALADLAGILDEMTEWWPEDMAFCQDWDTQAQRDMAVRGWTSMLEAAARKIRAAL
jgi:hypothetical protein